MPNASPAISADPEPAPRPTPPSAVPASSPVRRSPAAIRQLPEFREFRKRFFQAWKARHPGIARSRINAALQTLINQLARSPQDPQATLQHIMRTHTYTEPGLQAQAA